jgi:hypothetical protein
MIRPPVSPSSRFSPNSRLSTAHPELRHGTTSLLSPFPSQISPTPCSKPFAYTHFQKTPRGGVLLTQPFCRATPPATPAVSYAYAQFPSPTEWGRTTPPLPLFSKEYHSKAVIPGGLQKISFQRTYFRNATQGGSYSASNTNDPLTGAARLNPRDSPTTVHRPRLTGHAARAGEFFFSCTIHCSLFTTHCFAAKYPVLARMVMPSRFGLSTILRKVSSFSGSFG